MNGYPPVLKTLTTGTVLTASITDEPVSKPFGLTAGGATTALRVEIDIASSTGAPVVKLQQLVGAVFVDVKSVVVSGTTTAVIKLINTLVADQAYMPLASVCRVVASTAGGEALSVSAVRVLQAQ